MKRNIIESVLSVTISVIAADKFGMIGFTISCLTFAAYMAAVNRTTSK